MNKKEFFKKCDQADLDYPLQVKVVNAYREIYPVVELQGCWHNGVCVNVRLFTPQWRKLDFTKWSDVCHQRAIKFQRWLEEWKQANSVLSE